MAEYIAGEIQAVLVAIAATNLVPNEVGNIVGTFNSATGLMEFYWLRGTATDGAATLTILGADVNMTIKNKVGFTENKNAVRAYDPVLTQRAVGNALPQLSGPISVLVRSPDFSPNVWTKQERNNSDILSIINIAPGVFVSTIYHNTNPTLNEITSPLNKIRIRLSDELGATIDFNDYNCDFHFGLYVV